MAAPKLCRCGRDQRKKGNSHHCMECWLRTQPILVQIEHARLRLAAVPEPLRIAKMPEDLWPEGRKWCAACQTFRLLEDFGRGSKCRACASVGSHESRIRREYNLTAEDYQRLYDAQGGRCYLCGRRSIRVRLAVDHDHRTGEVRGLLCPDPEWGCNIKIVARFDADPDPVAMALRLLEYLRNPPARRILGDSTSA